MRDPPIASQILNATQHIHLVTENAVKAAREPMSAVVSPEEPGWEI